MDVVALAGEEPVRLDIDLHQRIAGSAAAESRAALSAQPQNLLVPGAGGDDDVERATIGQSDTLGRALQRFEKFHWKAVKRILPAQPNPSFAAAAERVPEDVLRLHEVGKAALASVDVRLGVGAVKIAIVSLARPLLSGGVNLPAIEARALLWISQEIIGAGDLLELFLCCFIAGIEVRMQLFRQLAVRLADLVLRRFPFHAQDSVGIIAHVALLA